MTLPSTVPHRLLPDAVFGGRFRIVGQVGEGAHGTVYSAVDLQTEETVALKVLHRHLLTDRQARRRFNREASILRRLFGPHIAALLAVGEHDELLFLALELARGPTLETLLARDGPLEPERAVRLMDQVLEALEHAHAAGVVHRDLKPGNIVVEPTASGPEQVRVLDFGLAKLLEGEGPGSTVLTEKNMVFGTPQYMSPEQSRGDEVDTRADVYAAGIVLYEMLTGTVPFSAPTPVATMTAHLVQSTPPPSLAKAWRGNPSLESVILTALHKAPEARFQSAREMRIALTEAAQDRPAGPELASGPVALAGPPGLPGLPAWVPRSEGGAPGEPSSVRPARSVGPEWGLPVSLWIAIGAAAGLTGIGIGVWIALR